jgi:multiple sugar transport system substrate-binding protein
MAVTTRARQRIDEIRPHLERLASRDTQEGLIPEQGGQPSSRSAWMSPQVNALNSNFYTDTLRTLNGAWTRPLAPSWPSFQSLASQIVRSAMRGEIPIKTAVHDINTTYSNLLVQ